MLVTVGDAVFLLDDLEMATEGVTVGDPVSLLEVFEAGESEGATVGEAVTGIARFEVLAVPTLTKSK